MIVIDSDNYRASGIETLFFPGGEPHAKVPRLEEFALLHLKLRTWSDVGLAACVISALERQRADFRAFIPYFPGARQDRSDGTAPVTVRLMGLLLATSRPAFVFDPHSDATHDSIECCAVMPCDLDLPVDNSISGVIAPDEGAAWRAQSYRAAVCPGADLIQCTKERDPHTGRLSNYRMPPLERTGRKVIVDDICDGGGTFNLFTEAYARDPLASRCELEMFVSHGIFSKGLDAISPLIRRITTTDSWCQLPDSDRLTVIPLLPRLISKLENASDV